MSAILGAFLAQQPGQARSIAQETPASAELVEMLTERVECAARAHPELALPAEALAAVLGRAVEGEDLLAGLAKIEVEDLALAFACSEADPRALAKFENEYGRDIDVAATRVPNLGIDRSDFLQRVRAKLFTAMDGPPRIASYAGRGSLRGWVRVTAMRVALDLSRRRFDPQHRVSEDADLVDRVAAGSDPELAFMRAQWGIELRELMSVALSRLSARQRNLLRYRYLQGLSTRGLAEMYDVHRATVFRWIDDARACLLDHLASVAREHLRVGADEIHSVVAMLGSRLDVSMRRLLDSEIEVEPT